MTLTLTTTQTQERLTVILFCNSSIVNGLAASVIVDGKAYVGVWNPVSSVFTYDMALERGPHTIYAQATDSSGTITTTPITYVMAYELTEYGIDLYSGDAKLDVIEPVLHDELLPALPTLNFSCATLLTGTIQAVIRERGLRKYQFTIDTVGKSGVLYQYTCLAAESYALTTAIMALQTAYGSTLDNIKLIVPSLNIVNASFLAQTTYPQLFANITPVDVIGQFMIQALAQASVRNGNLYVFPLDVSGQIPDYHMQRLDPHTSWQRDADIYDAVRAHYIVKQFPTPATVLTLNDSDNWTFDGDWADVTETYGTRLPIPSGASGMLWTNGSYASREGLSTLFRYFDRIRFNWNPVTATAVTISLQQDANNKLELTHTFAGQIGAGFVLNTGVAATDVLTKNIALDPVQFVTTVTGNTTANCSYRVTLLNAGGTTLWQDEWRSTISNTFEANVPTSVSQTYQATTVRIEFTNLYLIADDYGVQCITCYITKQVWTNVGSHQHVVSSTQYSLSKGCYREWWEDNHTIPTVICSVPSLSGGQTYSMTLYTHFHLYVPSEYGEIYVGSASVAFGGTISVVGSNICWYPGPWDAPSANFTSGNVYVTIVISETVQDYAWVSSLFVWSNAFNLFESVDLAFVNFVRTGNPVTLQKIVLTFTEDNYVDSLILVADNPLPVTVRAGTGSRAFVVTDDFGSEAGAQAYANGLLPIVSVAREQYTRDVSLATDLSVGDTVNADGVNMTVYAVDYRQDGKTIAAGRAMDILKTQLREQARRLDALERKV